MEKKFIGALILIIGICLISASYAINLDENNTALSNNISINTEETPENTTEDTQQTNTTTEPNNPQKTKNNIPSNVPQIIIKDNKEYMNTSHGQYLVKYTENGRKYYEPNDHTKMFITEFPIDENGNEYTIYNGTKYIIKYENGQRYIEINGEKSYCVEIGEGDISRYGNNTNQNHTNNITQYNERTNITQLQTNPVNNTQQTNTTTEPNNNQTNTNNTTTNQENEVQLESTGIPIAILLIALVGSIIGFKRKK